MYRSRALATLLACAAVGCNSPVEPGKVDTGTGTGVDASDLDGGARDGGAPGADGSVVDGGAAVDAGQPPAAPQIEPDRTQLSFGAEFGRAVYVGTVPVETLQLRNGGAQALAVETPTLSGPDSALFAVRVPAAKQSAAFGERAFVQVSYSPKASGTHHAVLHVVSNAADHPALEIPLTAQAMAPGAAGSGALNPECLGAAACERPSAGPPTASYASTWTAYASDPTLDYLDDRDGDGRAAAADNCPFVANRDQADGDGDGVGDACDDCPASSSANQSDLDGDGKGDVCDDDGDGDGLANAQDNCPSVPNQDQKASSGCPGQGIACCADADGDGVPNASDNCPLVANPDQTPPADTTGCSADSDADGVGDVVDVCVDVADPDQADLDHDGLGNACDADRDGDEMPDVRDDCVSVANPDQADSDRDGLGDTCDPVFCRVVDPAAPDSCLNANAPITVAGPSLSTSVGQAVRLPLFANRNGVALSYQWKVLTRAEGSTAAIESPAGWASASRDWQYAYPFGAVPRFTPDLAGQYDLQLNVTLVQPDRVYPDQTTAIATVRVVAH